jgi:hypothetical protein
MARLASAKEFIGLLEQGKYENAVNAQRAAGRTRLADAEKKKCFSAIEKHFGVAPGAVPAAKPAVAKKVARKVSKKVSRKSEPAPAPAAAAPLPGRNAGRGRVAKKVARRGRAAATAESAPEVVTASSEESADKTSSVLEILKVIDGTVNSGNGIMEALERVSKLGTSDIGDGVAKVRDSLTGAARLLHESVVAPLWSAGPQADPAIARRLEAVIATVPSPAQGTPPMDGLAYSNIAPS